MSRRSRHLGLVQTADCKIGLGWIRCPDLSKKGGEMRQTEYDRAKVPPYNGNDPPPAPGSLKTPLFPPLLNEVQNKGTQGVQARYGAELPPFISIVRYPGRPVILGTEEMRQTNKWDK